MQALVSSLGWTYLDVRSKLETEDVGKVRIAVNIPCVNCTKKWSSEQGKKVIQKEENEAFLAMVSDRQVANDIGFNAGIYLGLRSVAPCGHQYVLYIISCNNFAASMKSW